MKVLRACVVTAVVATTLSLGASIALFGEDNAARETRDRHEIEGLMWKYTRALDKGDGATYASTYTVDGQFTGGTNATTGREALTAREFITAGLAAQGLSNPQVARRLHVTVKTVESHLASAYRKLGVEQRGDLGKALEG